MTRVRGRDGRGFVTLWTVTLLAASWALVGLAFDGGRALRERSAAFGAAAAAARAGTQELDEAAVVEGLIQLDAEAARQSALASLGARGFAGSVAIDGLAVTVTVTGRTEFRILPGSAGYVVSASALPIRGPGPP